MVYTIEDLYYHYNYVPGNTGEWSDDEGCGSYISSINNIHVMKISIRLTVPVC